MSHQHEDYRRWIWRRGRRRVVSVCLSCGVAWREWGTLREMRRLGWWRDGARQFRWRKR